MQRRHFLRLIAAGLATPYLVTYSALARSPSDATPYRLGAAGLRGLQADPDYVFQQSVASGDPTPSGVVLWTRINPELVGDDLAFQVARDADFAQLVLEGVVRRDHIEARRDHTVKIDLDGQLEADTRYYYRFVYAGAVSRTGRCRTAPPAGAHLDRLKFALLTCQDYTNGYYGALDYVADDDSIDFVLHLGDFIYETAGDPRFQSLPYPDREIIMPSGGLVAMDLADYRHIYRSYRRDPSLRRALENHTWIITRDDHETANDCYWDYERHTLGAPDHPYTTEQGADPVKLNRLMLDSQQAWLEYVPARVRVEEASTDPQRFLRIYRNFHFGDLADLFVLDTRTYRTPHPCGEGNLGGRYLPSCPALGQPQHSMLGRKQREWLIDGLIASRSVWKVLGNQTFMGRLGVPGGNDGGIFNADAWDGYAYERDMLMQELKANRVDKLVTLTGDLHTYIASYLKADYANLNPFDFGNFVGVEFMTPSITSSNLISMLGLQQALALSQARRATVQTQVQAQQAQARSLGDLIDFFTSSAVYLLNPHIKYFNSSRYGYSTLELRRTYCEWTAYSVDKDAAQGATRRQQARYQARFVGSTPWLLPR